MFSYNYLVKMVHSQSTHACKDPTDYAGGGGGGSVSLHLFKMGFLSLLMYDRFLLNFELGAGGGGVRGGGSY